MTQPHERALIIPSRKFIEPKHSLEWLYRWIIPEPNSGCFLWLGALTDVGYGQARLFGRKMGAHRAAYIIAHNGIPEGLDVDRLCRVRCCVNPAHLEAVPHSVNIKRGIGPTLAAARQRAITHCPQGHEYAGENLEVSEKGYRTCQTCRRVSWKKYYDTKLGPRRRLLSTRSV